MKLPAPLAKVELVLPKELHIPRSLVVTGGILFLSFLSVSLGVPRLLDGSRQGNAIASQIAKATGQRVMIEGGVEVSVLPRPHIALSGFKLVSVDGSTTLLTAPRVDLNVTLASLLMGTYNVEEVKLVQPVLTLTAQQSAATPDLAALQVSRITIQDGTLDLALSGQPERISALNGTLNLPSGTTFLRAHMKADWRGAPLQMVVDLSPATNGSTPLGYLNLEVGAAEASLNMIGQIDLLKANRGINADVDIQAGQAASLWALFSSLGVMPVVPADTALRQKLNFGAHVEGDIASYSMSNITLQLGNWKANGLARYVTGQEGGLSVAFKTDAIDLAQWPSLAAVAQQGQFSIPAHVLGAFDLQIAGIAMGKLRAAPVLLKGDVNNGTIKLNELTAMLPGDARLQFVGSIASAADAPAQIDGKVQFEGLRLRDTLAGLGITLPATLEDTALRQMKAAATLRGPWMAWSIPDLTTTIDGIELAGQISGRTEGGPFDANFTVDQFDLDKYARTRKLPEWLWQLPPANVNVTFRQLRATGRMANNVVLTAAVAPNLLTIKSLDAADFGGNVLRLSGTLSPLEAQDADLTLRLTTPDFAQLRDNFEPVSLLLPEPVAQTLAGKVDLSVRYRRAAGELQQLSSAVIPDGRIDLVVTQKPEQPTTFKVRLQNRDSGAILNQLLSGTMARPNAVLGMADLYVEGEQQQGGAWQLASVQGQMAGVTVRSGNLMVVPGLPYAVTGSLQLANTNIDLWRQTLDTSRLQQAVAAKLDVSIERFTAAGQQLSDVTGQVSLTPPGGITLTNLTGNWQAGKVTLNGTGTLAPSLSVKGSLDVREAEVVMRGGDRYGVSGILDLGLRVEGQGSDWASLISSLNGDGEFSMDSGTLTGIDFATFTEALQDRNRTTDIATLLARGGESALSSFGGDFVIEEGMARAPVLRLRTPSASAELKADMDLSGPRLDAQARISLREIARAPEFSLTLTGPLQAIAGSYDVAALGAHLQGGTATAAAQSDENRPALVREGSQQAAAQPAADAGKPAQTTASDTPAQSNAAAPVAAIMPPEEPVPPSLDEPVATPVATAADLAGLNNSAPAAGAAAPRAAPRATGTATQQRRQNINAGSRAAAPRAAAPVARPATTGDDSKPPSIADMLAVMPALEEQAAAVVNEARVPAATTTAPVAEAASAPRASRRGSPAATAPAPAPAAPALSAGTPQIDFTPVTLPPAAAAPKEAVAPEFAGERPRTVRDTTITTGPNGSRVIATDGLTIRLPGEDEEGSGGMEQPAANVGDLMNRVQGQ